MGGFFYVPVLRWCRVRVYEFRVELETWRSSLSRVKCIAVVLERSVKGLGCHEAKASRWGLSVGDAAEAFHIGSSTSRTFEVGAVRQLGLGCGARCQRFRNQEQSSNKEDVLLEGTHGGQRRGWVAALGILITREPRWPGASIIYTSDSYSLFWYRPDISRSGLPGKLTYRSALNLP